MHGHIPYQLFGLGPDQTVIAVSHQTVGTTAGAFSASAQLVRKGTGWSGQIVGSYAATGIYTYTLPSGMILPAQPIIVIAHPQAATLATDWFECLPIGETTLNTTARQLVVQCHRNGTAQAPASTAGNRINLFILTQNNTGA